MTRHFKNIFTVLKTAYKEWMSKDPFRESAVIAYYSIFSLPGLLVVVVTMCRIFFWTRGSVNNHLTAQITGHARGANSRPDSYIIVKASEAKNSLLAAIIGVVTIIVGATGSLHGISKIIKYNMGSKDRQIQIGSLACNQSTIVFVRTDSFHCVYSDRVAWLFLQCCRLWAIGCPVIFPIHFISRCRWSILLCH
jgi:hypothetical protein